MRERAGMYKVQCCTVETGLTLQPLRCEERTSSRRSCCRKRVVCTGGYWVIMVVGRGIAFLESNRAAVRRLWEDLVWKEKRDECEEVSQLLETGVLYDGRGEISAVIVYLLLFWYTIEKVGYHV